MLAEMQAFQDALSSETPRTASAAGDMIFAHYFERKAN
jgi:hypothetical protein